LQDGQGGNGFTGSGFPHNPKCFAGFKDKGNILHDIPFMEGVLMCYGKAFDCQHGKRIKYLDQRQPDLIFWMITLFSSRLGFHLSLRIRWA